MFVVECFKFCLFVVLRRLVNLQALEKPLITALYEVGV